MISRPELTFKQLNPQITKILDGAWTARTKDEAVIGWGETPERAVEAFIIAMNEPTGFHSHLGSERLGEVVGHIRAKNAAVAKLESEGITVPDRFKTPFNPSDKHE